MVSAGTLTVLCMLLMSVALAVAVKFGRRRGISEARFDSETGKQISND